MLRIQMKKNSSHMFRWRFFDNLQNNQCSYLLKNMNHIWMDTFYSYQMSGNILIYNFVVSGLFG